MAIICPDCGCAFELSPTHPQCPLCRRPFGSPEGVWDLRPSKESSWRVAEEALHAELGLPTWRRLMFHKLAHVQFAEEYVLPRLGLHDGARLLELGGGLCYVSALAKASNPRVHVTATDLSRNYLIHHAVKVGMILNAPAVDVYAAVDASRIPFADNSFDAVHSQMLLYRMPNPYEALNEIWRVLRRGGRWLGIERAWPWWFRGEWRETLRLAQVRHIYERPQTYGDWSDLVRSMGLDIRLKIIPGNRVRRPCLRRMMNAIRSIRVAIWMEKPA